MSKFVFIIIMLFVLNVVLNACSGHSKADEAANKCAAVQSNGREFSGIVNGKTLGAGNAFSSRVVSILMKDGDELGTCTGSLLPGNVVLTASHCVASKSAIVFSTDWSCTGEKSEVRKVVTKVLYPEARPHGKASDNIDSDIALLKFEGQVPAGYAPFDLPSRGLNIRQDENVMMVGYGRTGADVEGDQVLRITSNRGSQVSEAGPRSFLVDQRQTGVCKGDSGGPLIVMRNGVPQLVGVASAVANSESDGQDKMCSGVSYYVNTSAVADWIRQAHARLTR